MDEHLRPTWFIDADHPSIRQKSIKLLRGIESPKEQAVALFHFVRDGFPYKIIYEIPGREYFRASDTLRRGEGFCMPKSILLAALARSAGIPSRLHFADIRNHILPRTTTDRLKTDIMAYHTYVGLFLDGKWVKATPSFDIGFCHKFGLLPVDFDGEHDALLHHLDTKGRVHIEYVADYGTRGDFPVDEVIEAFKRTYPHIPRLTAALERA